MGSTDGATGDGGDGAASGLYAGDADGKYESGHPSSDTGRKRNDDGDGDVAHEICGAYLFGGLCDVGHNSTHHATRALRQQNGHAIGDSGDGGGAEWGSRVAYGNSGLPCASRREFDISELRIDAKRQFEWAVVGAGGAREWTGTGYERNADTDGAGGQ